MASKKLIKKTVEGALMGYIVIHPLVMIISYLMSNISRPYVSLAKTGILSTISSSFSIHMLPWGLAFAVLGGLVSLYYNKLNQSIEEKARLIIQLESSLSEIKKLSGFLPICASCKKIRDDKGYWNQIESYIKEHSEAQFSHGICPDCAKKLYPDLFKENDSTSD